MVREAWLAAVHGVSKSRTWLRDLTELNWTEGGEDPLEEEMATYFSNLAWKIS